MRRLLVPLVLPLLVVAGCADDGSSADAGMTTGGTAATIEDDVTVFAAASLTESFTAVAEAFEADHPGVDVELNFAASSQLVAAIGEGAPADVYASADEANMRRLVDADDHAAPPEVFARNSLAIAVEAGNPLRIDGIADLAEPDLLVVTCDPAVPIGAYSEEVLANAGVDLVPDSYEEDVKAVLSKVVLGEADAGVVYATDVRAAGSDVTGIEIPADVNVTPAYPITVTADAPNPAGAAAFTAFVLGPAGQRILADHGFTAP